jgi:hypothetical protein
MVTDTMSHNVTYKIKLAKKNYHRMLVQPEEACMSEWKVNKCLKESENNKGV